MNAACRRVDKNVTVVAVVLFGVVLGANLAMGQSGLASSDKEQAAGQIAKLNDPNASVRVTAADKLGTVALRIKDATALLPAVERLVTLMDDDSEDIRDETAEALGIIASRVVDKAALKSAIAALIEGLSDKSGEVREESAEALARIASTIKDKALLELAVEPLTRTLTDGAAATRGFAWNALEFIREDEASATMQTARANARFLELLRKREVDASGAMKLSTKDVNRKRYLVLDSRVIERVEHARLTVGAVRKDENNPLFGEDKPWEPRFDNPYCMVIYDEEEKVYKCWYNGFIESKLETETPREKRAWVNWGESPRAGGVCYAVSKDGVHWEKPELGIVDFQGSKNNNIVLRAEHGFGIMKDPHETDPQKRYKAIRARANRSSVWFSPDGLHWGEKREVGPIDNGDTNNCVFWDPTLNKYVLFTRHWGGPKTAGRYGGHGYRQVSRSESSDFVNWTRGEVVLVAPNPHQQQIHDLIVFRHAGVYVGLVGLWDMVADREHVELAWSPDSRTWNWIEPGKALIPNSRHIGDYDWGCIFAIPPIFKKDEILLYYGANNNRFFGWRDGFLCLAHLRPDGFAGYEDFPGGTDITAAITTKPVVAVSDSLCLSADVALSGYVKVVLIDEDNKQLAESELISKTVTDAPVQWKDGFSLADRGGKKIQLRFELRDAKLYSFSFDD